MVYNLAGRFFQYLSLLLNLLLFFVFFLSFWSFDMWLLDFSHGRIMALFNQLHLLNQLVFHFLNFFVNLIFHNFIYQLYNFRTFIYLSALSTNMAVLEIELTKNAFVHSWFNLLQTLFIHFFFNFFPSPLNRFWLNNLLLNFRFLTTK